MEQLLTRTQDEVIRYKLQGFTRKEIAYKTFRSPGTIQRHFQDIYEKLNIRSEIDLYNWYAENVLKINIRKLLQVTILLCLVLFESFASPDTILRARRARRVKETEIEYIITE